MLTNELKHFSQQAERFRSWALRATSKPDDRAVEALALLAELCSAVVPLLPLADLGDDPEPDVPRVSDHEWHQVFAKAGDLPPSVYFEVYDPWLKPPEAVVAAHLADDLRDVFRDIVDGLRLFEAGHYRRAHWHWVFSFQHWGEHATSAIRALFMHLREQGVLDGQGHV